MVVGLLGLCGKLHQLCDPPHAATCLCAFPALRTSDGSRVRRLGRCRVDQPETFETARADSAVRAGH